MTQSKPSKFDTEADMIAFVRTCFEVAKGSLESDKPPAQLIPMATIITAEGEVNLVALAGEEHPGLQLSAFLLSMFPQGVRLYCIAHEAWAVTIPKDELDRQQCQPKDHPDRRDVVVASGWWRDRGQVRSCSVQANVTRRGLLVAVGEVDDLPVNDAQECNFWRPDVFPLVDLPGGA